jgi:hypothetical protein
MTLVPVKPCTACHISKPLASYYRYHRSRDGHLGICKRCFLARQAVYKAKRRAVNRWLWMTG